MVQEMSSFRELLSELLEDMETEHHHGKSGQTAITLIPEVSPDGTVRYQIIPIIHKG